MTLNVRPFLTLLAIALTMGQALPGVAQQRPATLFAQGGVRSDASADNAVDAKTKATLQAEARAFRLLLMKLTDFQAQARLPSITPEETERLVTGIEVRNEGVSGTGYGATFTVAFSERAVREMLGQAGVPLIEERSPEILIVPIYIESGSVRTGERNPWRKALSDLDLTHSHVPGRVAAPRGDITAAIANAFIASPSASLETLKSQYRAPLLVFAVAEADAGSTTLDLKVIGVDAVGTFDLTRKIKAGDEIGDATFGQAAQITFGAIQTRWKTSQSPAVASADGPGAGSLQPAPTGPGEPMQITAQYSGLKEWQTIRVKLQRVPGVQNLDLKSVDARSAEITLTYPGGASAFAGAAPANGLSVENGSDGLILRTQ